MTGDCRSTIGEILDASIRVQRILGRGLYEHPYRDALSHELVKRGHQVEREVAFSAFYEDLILHRAFRADLLVDGRVIVELKAVDRLAPIHFAQARTYLRFSGCAAVVLVNFHAPRIIDGFFPIHSDSLFPLPVPSASPGVTEEASVESSRKG
ncbi:MAG: hypothetical protein QOE90_310 [Thermoplasmata archaeon]|nr:hypothetical protein [Thermoplasmata archaeon]